MTDRTSLSVNLLLICIVSTTQISAEDRVKELCDTCRELAHSFQTGFKVTDKKGFAGGDVVWEENKLGKYEFSEVRLLDIMEKVCPPKAYQCETMLENYEEEIEKWFFKLRKEEKDFSEWLCMKTVKVCCPFNTFGPNCQECPGNDKLACGGHGKCDGNGTKSGNGSCECETGYTGSICESCTSGYLRNGSECKACHVSCDGDCLSEGPKGCLKCDVGWTHNDELGCTDINECEANACDAGVEDCENTEGSFTCKCKKGFKKEGDVCIPDDSDAIDEAAAAASETDPAGDGDSTTKVVEGEKAAEVESHEEL